MLRIVWYLPSGVNYYLIWGSRRYRRFFYGNGGGPKTKVLCQMASRTFLMAIYIPYFRCALRSMMVFPLRYFDRNAPFGHQIIKLSISRTARLGILTLGSQSLQSANVKAQLPSFPFGCYTTNPA